MASAVPFLLSLIGVFLVAWFFYLWHEGAPPAEILPDVRETRWDDNGHH
ncbi:MAG: hypothetical protein GXO36_01615 [Chloroflexi bacterium]|nr:hypothetical protein [Chloroflexota bacterium]